MALQPVPGPTVLLLALCAFGSGFLVALLLCAMNF